MALAENFQKKNKLLQQKVLLEIERSNSGHSDKNVLQLQTILEELQNCYPKTRGGLSYPRIIIDSWDHTDELGIELIELADLYLNI